MKKRTKLITAAVSLGALMTVGGTLAWFTDSETATNTVTTGNVNVKITEEVPSKDEQEKGGFNAQVNEMNGISYERIVPGTKISKDPVIQYIGVSDAYVRYKVVIDGIDEKNVKFYKGDVEVTDKIFDLTEDYVYCEDICSTGDFLKYEDGVVSIAKNPEELFTKFELVGGNELADLKGVSISIKADAIQAANLPDADNDGKITKIDIADAFGGDDVDPYTGDAQQ